MSTWCVKFYPLTLSKLRVLVLRHSLREVKCGSINDNIHKMAFIKINITCRQPTKAPKKDLSRPTWCRTSDKFSHKLNGYKWSRYSETNGRTKHKDDHSYPWEIAPSQEYSVMFSDSLLFFHPLIIAQWYIVLAMRKSRFKSPYHHLL